MKSGNQFELPTKRRSSPTEILARFSPGRIILLGLGAYVLTPVLFTIIEMIIGQTGNMTVSGGAIPAALSFRDLLYFNFISILTIGYGDLSPLGAFRAFVIIEAILGITIYSLLVSVVTIKLLLPRKNVIVFSRYAYFCKDDNSFMIIYLNTAKQFITNLETSWYFKLNEDWHTRVPGRVPFITKSVQTFYLKYGKSLDSILPKLHPQDCLRVGLSGSLGMSTYSTSVQYDLKDILVIDNRSVLRKYAGFYQVDKYLAKAEFQEYFHYCPAGTQTFEDLLNARDSK